MTIAILGYGKEGKSVESYFRKKHKEVKIFDNFSKEDLKKQDFSQYELVFRSPSAQPIQKNWTSVTKYFFQNCPCPIIGVTGTKGKGTTCSLITAILKSLNKSVYLVGNIGTPAIDILDNLTEKDIVVYEMSSFQLWDLDISPQISVILHIEPDHLNVHADFEEYISAKANIVRNQKSSDSCIYFQNNPDSVKIAKQSKAKLIPYPSKNPSNKLQQLLFSLSIPGKHNQENVEAALNAVASFLKKPLKDFIDENYEVLNTTLQNFQGLPHRLEFIREKDGIKFYDDNFSTTLTSTEVAIKSFPTEKIILIAGGRDKTDYKNLDNLNRIFTDTQNIQNVILIGESGHKLFSDYENKKYILAESLQEAINKSIDQAKITKSTLVLMSPAAASFDMFENVYDRGTQYQSIIKNL